MSLPLSINSRTFVPVRFVSEAFGAGVDWDQALGTAVITYFSMT
ncbi:MAG: copper amine oxidase N-terminal domain-containing protein [Oscillospiraceae bacterium]|nr:copper amine oxidase N-terminal domain-containing protein [Oscillospiraceae bacterium]